MGVQGCNNKRNSLELCLVIFRCAPLLVRFNLFFSSLSSQVQRSKVEQRAATGAARPAARRAARCYEADDAASAVRPLACPLLVRLCSFFIPSGVFSSSVLDQVAREDMLLVAKDDDAAGVVRRLLAEPSADQHLPRAPGVVIGGRRLFCGVNAHPVCAAVRDADRVGAFRMR